MNSSTCTSIIRRADGGFTAWRALTFSSTTWRRSSMRVQVNVLERADTRIDVAGHGEIEHEHRAVTPLVQRLLHRASPMT